MKKYLIFLVVLLAIPTFWLMLRPGIYSMQDFHYFRLVEFDKCVQDLQIPCRWAPDAGLGYGEPLFNFYAPLPYVVGEIFHLLSFSFIDSLKLAFIFSLVGSAIAMYFLAKKMWKSEIAALISSILYLYAPYRAVDVWVRGALPEALSFVLFPLIILVFEDYVRARHRIHLVWFGILLGLLIATHNLSVVLFAPFLIVWTGWRLFRTKNINLPKSIIISGVVAFGVSAFYLLPALVESKYVNIASTAQGYFDFRGHFVGIGQLLFSRYWGYGASVFGPEDGLNLSVGFVQWIVPLALIALIVVKKKAKLYTDVFVLVALGWFYLFLIHNLSTPIWLLADFMKFIQFPWRFLGVAVFCFSLVSGAIVDFLHKRTIVYVILIIVATIFLTATFFREDIWHDYKDSDLTSGSLWEEQTRASIGDYWPIAAGAIPTQPAATQTSDYILESKSSNKQVFRILSDNPSIQFPINIFPGWTSYQIGDRVVFEYKNTTSHKVGNIITVATIGVLAYFLLVKKNKLYEEK